MRLIFGYILFIVPVPAFPAKKCFFLVVTVTFNCNISEFLFISVGPTSQRWRHKSSPWIWFMSFLNKYPRLCQCTVTSCTSKLDYISKKSPKLVKKNLSSNYGSAPDCVQWLAVHLKLDYISYSSVTAYSDTLYFLYYFSVCSAVEFFSNRDSYRPWCVVHYYFYGFRDKKPSRWLLKGSMAKDMSAVEVELKGNIFEVCFRKIDYPKQTWEIGELLN